MNRWWRQLLRIQGKDYAVAAVIFASIFMAAVTIKAPPPKGGGGLPVVPYAAYRETPKSTDVKFVLAEPTRRSAAKTYVAVPRNCNEARARGIAPMYRGGPGYGAHMDGDNDGIACEPYRGRR